MTNAKYLLEELSQTKYNIEEFSNKLESLYEIHLRNMKTTDKITYDIIDSKLLKELQAINNLTDTNVYFGVSMRDIKIVIQDSETLRDHEIMMEYRGPKKLVITSATIPLSHIQDQVFGTIEEVVTTFKKYIDSLSNYFYELERIDKFCTIMEPKKATFRDNYRRILLDSRTWLHIEVTPEGLATNIHLVGKSEQWQEKLQIGLMSWDHDKDIVENVMNILDLTSFPEKIELTISQHLNMTTNQQQEEAVECSICLCSELPETSALPLPLCQNVLCGVYFHRSCLFQWLVACSGNIPPAFGVASGSCPSCLQPITCSEKDG